MGGKIKGLLGSGVGLVSEAISYQNEKRSGPRSGSRYESRTSDYSRTSYQSSYACPIYNTATSQRDHQNNWEDNDYAEASWRSDMEEPQYTSALAQNRMFYEEDCPSYSEIMGPSSPRSLSLPVIIPQRRPENQSRGWAVAYAPALMESGIDEATFIKFITKFNQACDTSPVLDAVNLGAFAVGFAPGIAPMVVSMAVPVAVQVAKGAQTKTQSASYLRRANAEIFEPRGLVAFVTTWEPNQTSQVVTMNTQTSRQQDPYGPQLQLPASAPLVFRSELDMIDNQSRNRYQRTTGFIGDYFDKRAQLEYSKQHPELSHLTPEPQFRSRWGDPRTMGANDDAKDSRKKDKKDKKDRKDRRKDRKSKRRDSSSDDDEDNQSSRGGLIGTALGAVAGQRGQDMRSQGLIGGLRGMATGSGGQQQQSRGSGDQGPIGGLRGRAIDNGRQDDENERPEGLIGGLKSMALGPKQQNQGLIKGLKARSTQQSLMYLMIVNKPPGGPSAQENYYSGDNRTPPDFNDWDRQQDYAQAEFR